jgi:hypothetical protein
MLTILFLLGPEPYQWIPKESEWWMDGSSMIIRNGTSGLLPLEAEVGRHPQTLFPIAAKVD